MAVAEQGSRPLPTMPAAPAPAARAAKLLSGLAVFGRSRTALVGLFLVGFWVFVAFFADNCLVAPACWVQSPSFKATPWLARYSPYQQFSGQVLKGPSADHWLGTDRQGRDLWARLAYGSRTILVLAPISVLIALGIGGALGLMAGYYGGLGGGAGWCAPHDPMGVPPILRFPVLHAAPRPAWGRSGVGSTTRRMP